MKVLFQYDGNEVNFILIICIIGQRQLIKTYSICKENAMRKDVNWDCVHNQEILFLVNDQNSHLLQ